MVRFDFTPPTTSAFNRTILEALMSGVGGGQCDAIDGVWNVFTLNETSHTALETLLRRQYPSVAVVRGELDVAACEGLFFGCLELHENGVR